MTYCPAVADDWGKFCENRLKSDWYYFGQDEAVTSSLG